MNMTAGFHTPKSKGLGSLTLDDFVLEMSHTKTQELTLDRLKELVLHLDLKDELIQEHIRFQEGQYARNLVCRTPKFDMLVLCWKPGQVTSIHDHAGSLNVTRVFGGELTSRLFAESDRPGPGRCLVKKKVEERLSAHAVACVDIGEIHPLANESASELVTLHFYARPLKDITVYCPNTGEIERVTLRYSLEDDFA